MSEIDNRLVTRYRGGDRGAGAALYQRHGRRVKAYLRRSGFSSHDADDLAQEIFMKAFRSINTFDPARGAFATWLGAIARNAARKAWRTVARPGDFDPHLAGEVFAAAADDDPAAREELQILKGCVAQLDEDHRGLVRMRYYDAMTTRGIAAGTGIPEATVRLRLDEAMGLLVACMRKKN